MVLQVRRLLKGSPPGRSRHIARIPMAQPAPALVAELTEQAAFHAAIGSNIDRQVKKPVKNRDLRKTKQNSGVRSQIPQRDPCAVVRYSTRGVSQPPLPAPPRNGCACVEDAAAPSSCTNLETGNCRLYPDFHLAASSQLLCVTHTNVRHAVSVRPSTCTGCARRGRVNPEGVVEEVDMTE